MENSDFVFMGFFLLLPIGFLSMATGYIAVIAHYWRYEDRKVLIKRLLISNDMTLWQSGPRYAPWLVMLGAACGVVGFAGLLIASSLGYC